MDNKTNEQSLPNYWDLLKSLTFSISNVEKIFSQTGSILSQNERMAEVFAPLNEFKTKLNSAFAKIFDEVASLQIHDCDEQAFSQFMTEFNKANSLLEESKTKTPLYHKYAEILTDPNVNLDVDALQLSEFADKVNADYQENAIFVSNFGLTYDEGTQYGGMLSNYQENMQKAEANAKICKELAENPLQNRLDYAIQIVDHDDQTRSLRNSMEYYKYTLESPYYDDDGYDGDGIDY